MAYPWKILTLICIKWSLLVGNISSPCNRKLKPSPVILSKPISIGTMSNPFHEMSTTVLVNSMCSPICTLQLYWLHMATVCVSVCECSFHCGYRLTFWSGLFFTELLTALYLASTNVFHHVGKSKQHFSISTWIIFHTYTIERAHWNTLTHTQRKTSQLSLAAHNILSEAKFGKCNRRKKSFHHIFPEHNFPPHQVVREWVVLRSHTAVHLMGLRKNYSTHSTLEHTHSHSSAHRQGCPEMKRYDWKWNVKHAAKTKLPPREKEE